MHGTCHIVDLEIITRGAVFKTRKLATVYPDMSMRPSARATLAMFFGVTALVPGTCLGPVGLSLGLLGAILGRIELSRIRKSPASHESEIFALIGYYIGITGFFISLLVLLAYYYDLPG